MESSECDWCGEPTEWVGCVPAYCLDCMMSATDWLFLQRNWPAMEWAVVREDKGDFDGEHSDSIC